jgi:dTDP-4-dehydrorhamnose 3,5-epimerase
MTDSEVVSETHIEGCFIMSSAIHDDSRGSFREWFKKNSIFDFDMKQGNFSASNLGVLRGMHFSIGKQSQAKVVTCVSGEIQDVLVDVRPDSPTFKEVVSVNLSPTIGQSLLIAPGVAHGFLALKEGAVVVYLTSEKYEPSAERSLNALDPLLEGVWSLTGFKRSRKDEEAPYLKDLHF